MMGRAPDTVNADEIHERHLQDPEYRREYERTKLANDVAIKVITYRVQHDLTQSQLARRLGWRQPNVARLEAGDHEPSVGTLARLADVLGLDFSLDIKRGKLRLRHTTRDTGPSTPAPTHRTTPRRRRSAEVRVWAEEHEDARRA